MIPKELKASPIFGEFSSEDQNRYFNLSKEKVCAHVDTLYYTVSIFNDSNELPGVGDLLNQLKDLKAQKALFPSKEVDFFGLSFDNTRFVHYEYCLRLEEQFDIFISSMLPNAYKPTTAPNLSYIDFCFVKSSQFKTLSYKVLNDHPLAIYTSDHYPVVSEILCAKTYEDVLLPVKGEFPELPGNPVYDGYDDDFFSEEDRVGF